MRLALLRIWGRLGNASRWNIRRVGFGWRQRCDRCRSAASAPAASPCGGDRVLGRKRVGGGWLRCLRVPVAQPRSGARLDRCPLDGLRHDTARYVRAPRHAGEIPGRATGISAGPGLLSRRRTHGRRDLREADPAHMARDRYPLGDGLSHAARPGRAHPSSRSARIRLERFGLEEVTERQCLAPQEETRPPVQDLRHVLPAFHMAQEVGARLGQRPVLLGPLPPKQAVNTGIAWHESSSWCSGINSRRLCPRSVRPTNPATSF